MLSGERLACEAGHYFFLQLPCENGFFPGVGS